MTAQITPSYLVECSTGYDQRGQHVLIGIGDDGAHHDLDTFPGLISAPIMRVGDMFAVFTQEGVRLYTPQGVVERHFPYRRVNDPWVAVAGDPSPSERYASCALWHGDRGETYTVALITASECREFAARSKPLGVTATNEGTVLWVEHEHGSTYTVCCSDGRRGHIHLPEPIAEEYCGFTADQGLYCLTRRYVVHIPDPLAQPTLLTATELALPVLDCCGFILRNNVFYILNGNGVYQEFNAVTGSVVSQPFETELCDYDDDYPWWEAYTFEPHAFTVTAREDHDTIAVHTYAYDEPISADDPVKRPTQRFLMPAEPFNRRKACHIVAMIPVPR